MEYFNNIKDILLKEFTLKMPLDSKNQSSKRHILDSKTSISLHVRRGDYINLSDFFVILDSIYYNGALNAIKKRLQNIESKPVVFIFSDDILWCKNVLLQNLDSNITQYFSFEFMENNDEGNAAFELELMKSCKHNIIANSTFSWWAAYLNTNPHKIIIAPNKFLHTPESKKSTSLQEYVLKSDWIKIDIKTGNEI